MTSSIPVYGEIANLLNEQPEIIKDISKEYLQPILALNLLNPDAHLILTIKELNANHQIATDMPTEDLLKIIKWADEQYYNLNLNLNSNSQLEDRVYDYIKRVYGQRTHMTMEKEKTMLSVSSETGVGIRPTKGRDTRLPVPLRSLDNVFMGEGDVDKWKSTHKGPYNLSAKMDGTSGLYYNGILYTRGDATVGRNISHILPYLNLPKVSYAVRGELVIDRHIFDNKYKDKPSKTSGTVRKINRNSVAGALGSITHLDEDFFKDLTFVAYEIITLGPTPQMRPSDQFRKLLLDGFSVASSRVVSEISDEVLSSMYHDLVHSYNYEVDGVVLQVDQPYVRETDKNPDYAKSYKEALAQDVAVTKIITIEWNVSQYGYLVPTVIYEPVSIGGVTLQRATAHNAREVQKLGLGPGAVIEVVYRAKVNPQVNRVIKPVQPDMPTVPYKWIETGGGSSGEPVNIMFKEEEAEGSDSAAGMMDSIRIKRIHKFLVEIGAKGIGETTVEKIYNTSGYRTVGDFINIKLSDVLFLGKQASQNIYNSIKDSMKQVNLPTLMASSKVFGRGLGTKKFTKVFELYPDFAVKRHNYEEYHRMLLQVDGFADKTSTLAAKGMVDFWEFIDTQLSAEIYTRIISNTTFEASVAASPSPGEIATPPPLQGKNVYLTGVRSQQVLDIVKRQGGTVQASFTGSTNILVRKDADYGNKKTEEAEQKGVPILTIEEFLKIYS